MKLLPALLLPCLLLAQYAFEKGTTLGRPDTIKLLVSPQKVVERGDTVVVLDEEWKDHLTLKSYTLDGFFISARPYVPDRDSSQFEGLWTRPDSATCHRYRRFEDPEYHYTWLGLTDSRDSTVWVVFEEDVGGDAGVLELMGFHLRDSSVVAESQGPVEWDAYATLSYRNARVPRKENHILWLHAGRDYVYLVAMGNLHQYDKQLVLIREVGALAGAGFREPAGIAVDKQGRVCIADFKLGVTFYDPSRQEPTPLPRGTDPESLGGSVHLSLAGDTGIWVSGTRRSATLLVDGKVSRTVPFGNMPLSEGGALLQVEPAGSLLVVFRSLHNMVYVYGASDEPVEMLRLGWSEEHMHGEVCGLDNRANVYGRNAGRVFRLPPLGSDTTWIDLPPVRLPYRLDWQCCYRIADTLYVLGTRQDGRDEPPSHGIYVFVHDRYGGFFDESDFEGGLQGWVTDFAVAPDGSFWFVDIGQRIVQEYRRVSRQDE